MKGVRHCATQKLKECLIQEVKAIKIEVRSRAIENHDNHIVACPTNEEKDAIKSIVRWAKSARVFRKSARKSGLQGIRSLLLVS